MKKTRRILLAVIIIFLIIVVRSFPPTPNEMNNKITYLETRLLIERIAEQHAAGYLKKPSSATYISNCILLDTLLGTFDCKIKASSMNSLGGYGVTNFDIKMKYDIEKDVVSLLKITY